MLRLAVFLLLTEDRHRYPKMSDNSKSTPLFANSCREVLSRLEGDASEQARAYATRARELLAILDDWKEEAPTREDRVTVISRVLDLHRAVMEHVTSSREEPRPA